MKEARSVEEMSAEERSIELEQLVLLEQKRPLTMAELERYYRLHGHDPESAAIYAEAGGMPRE